jgi:hypothetical protein
MTRQQLLEILELLHEVEWVDNSDGEYIMICQICLGQAPGGGGKGHEPSCKLVEAIKWLEDESNKEAKL